MSEAGSTGDSEILRVQRVGEEDNYRNELEQTRAQMMMLAREIGDFHARERRQSNRLQEMLDSLKKTYLGVVHGMAQLVEARDEYTRYHLERTKGYASALAQVIDVSLAAPEVAHGYLLHDVGKAGVPDAILSKPGALTNEEMRVMRSHPIHGIQIVEPMGFLVPEALEVIRHHHERFDGDGYPDGLRGEGIPLAARIFSVADAFDAMTTDRPYRSALSNEEAVRRLDAESGTQFDPDVVAAFVELMAEG